MRIKIVLFLSFSLFLYTFSYAGVISGLRVLSFTSSARALAMAETFIANPAGDIYSVYYNPAGLAAIQSRQIGYTYFKSFQDTTYSFVGAGLAVKENLFLAGSVGNFDGGDIELNNADGTSAIVKAQQDNVYTISFANKVTETHSAGLNLKFIQSQLLQEYSGNTVAVDGGIIYKICDNSLLKFVGGKIEKDELYFGVSIKNIGPKFKYKEEKDMLPLSLNLGIAYNVNITGTNKLSLEVDLIKPVDLGLKMSAGAEFALNNFIFLRAGSKIESGSTRYAYGIGLNFKSLQFDYAVATLSDVQSNQRISLTLRF